MTACRGGRRGSAATTGGLVEVREDHGAGGDVAFDPGCGLVSEFGNAVAGGADRIALAGVAASLLRATHSQAFGQGTFGGLGAALPRASRPLHTFALGDVADDAARVCGGERVGSGLFGVGGTLVTVRADLFGGRGTRRGVGGELVGI